MSKHSSTQLKVILIALILGVIVPYTSYRLREDDTCMPEQAGLAYFPVISPLGEGCLGAFIGEIGLFTIGLPSVLAGIFTMLIASPPTNIFASLRYGWFCLPPLTLSLIWYLALIALVRRITNVKAKRDES